MKDIRRWLVLCLCVLFISGCTIQNKSETENSEETTEELSMEMKYIDTYVTLTDDAEDDLLIEDDTHQRSRIVNTEPLLNVEVVTLESCNGVPQDHDSCAKNGILILDDDIDSEIILLNVIDNVRLYGVRTDKQQSMLLCVDEETVWIDYSFSNFYGELPELKVEDMDCDGIEEIGISLRTYTGSICRYGMLVCDYEDEWLVYEYCGYLQDIEERIAYRYEEDTDEIVFLWDEKVIAEVELPEWTKEYPYEGVVEFNDNFRFEAETMQLTVKPGILLENSLSYRPIEMVFDVSYREGVFEIELYNINKKEESVSIQMNMKTV